MLVYLVIVAFLLWYMSFRYQRRRMYTLANAIPGPKEELPFLGISHLMSGDTESIMTSLQNFSYMSMKNNGILRAWIGPKLYFVLVNPVDVEMVLKTCLEKDELHRFLQKIIGYGGIFAPVSIWRRRRKILVPAFSPKIVESFLPIFVEQAEKLTKQITHYIDSGKSSLWPLLSTYTLDAVCETNIGIKLNAQENPDLPFLVSMCQVLNIICKRIFHLWLQPDWMFKLFPSYRTHQACIKVLHDFTDKVISNKREEIKKEKDAKPEVDHEYDLSLYKRKTFLDLLITLSGGDNGYTNKELREEVLTLSIAGTDTSAVALGYTLMLLGKYPEIQEKVYQELCEVFEDRHRLLVKDDLSKLKYLERVIKESLRLFPPVPLIIRRVTEETKLPSGNVLPVGSGVACSIWGSHRDPNYWGPTAEHFDPDRFLPERFNLVHACSYMPFSNGPRNCVGYQYALMSVKTAAATILRKFKVVGDVEPTQVPKIRVKLDIMMKAVDGFKVALEKREKLETVTPKQEDSSK